MKAIRFGNGTGSGEKWDEGEVFEYVKKFDGQTIFNDTSTIAVRNEEVMSYTIRDRPIKKNGKQRIKSVAFNVNTSDIDTKDINIKLVYEVKGNKVVPVWHVGYNNYVFKYDASTGVSYNENP